MAVVADARGAVREGRGRARGCGDSEREREEEADGVGEGGGDDGCRARVLRRGKRNQDVWDQGATRERTNGRGAGGGGGEDSTTVGATSSLSIRPNGSSSLNLFFEPAGRPLGTGKEKKKRIRQLRARPLRPPRQKKTHLFFFSTGPSPNASRSLSSLSRFVPLTFFVPFGRPRRVLSTFGPSLTPFGRPRAALFSSSCSVDTERDCRSR